MCGSSAFQPNRIANVIVARITSRTSRVQGIRYQDPSSDHSPVSPRLSISLFISLLKPLISLSGLFNLPSVWSRCTLYLGNPLSYSSLYMSPSCVLGLCALVEFCPTILYGVSKGFCVLLGDGVVCEVTTTILHSSCVFHLVLLPLDTVYL